MWHWLRSSTLLKHLVGQHIVNGLSVAASVATVTIVSSLSLGFAAGQPATLGAIGASISDFPGPWRVKVETILVGFSLSIVSTTLIQLSLVSPIVEILTLGVIALGAGLVTGFGRWALALSAQVLVPLVFVLGLPPMSFEQALRAQGIYILGGLGYITISLALTFVSAPADRRMMASEAFRELAAYLVAISRLANVDVDLAEAYGGGLRQQAALSDQLQSARGLLLAGARKSPERTRLAATIGVQLDVFDGLVAATCDLPRLRGTPEASKWLARIEVLLRAAALDLQRLSLDLIAHRTPRLPPDHARAFEALRREAARLTDLESFSEEDKAAVRATMRRLAAARADILRLERTLADPEYAKIAIADIDLAAFRPRRSFNPRLLKPHLSSGSPVLRYAVRLSLAMMAGGIVAAGFGGERHGNWVLLTIAVILRPTYGLTRQRRDHRLIGTLVGCVFAAGAVAYLPLAALVGLQSLSLALVHGFVRLNYWLASIGASMSALISLHLIAPADPAPVLNRLADTVVGAAIAHVFNFVWQSWELTVAPALAKRLLARAFGFAGIALDPKASDQDYRLARKDFIEAVAALSDSAARMGGEPVTERRGLEEMTQMLIATSVFVANVSATRLDLREARQPAAPERLSEIEAIRKWLSKRLVSTTVPAAPQTASASGLPRAAESLIAAANAFAKTAAAA